MKIAIPSTKPDLTGTVEHKLGTAKHVLIVESNDMSFTVEDGPPPSAGHGAGVMAISLAASLGAKAILVGHAAPHIIAALQKQSIDVVTDVTGTVEDAVANYVQSQHNTAPSPNTKQQNPWTEAFLKGLRQFYAFLPRLIGVILILGLFRGFISEQTLLSLFSGSALKDTLWGATLGSILAGNPVNSYVIGESLLRSGVGLAGVMALMLTWVNVGLLQLPAEIEALGRRFAIVRNITGFVVAVAMAFLMTMCLGGAS